MPQVVARPKLPLHDWAMRRRVQISPVNPCAPGAVAQRGGQAFQVGVRQPGWEAAGSPCGPQPNGTGSMVQTVELTLT
jgi:hypothetical protein